MLQGSHYGPLDLLNTGLGALWYQGKKFLPAQQHELARDGCSRGVRHARSVLDHAQPCRVYLFQRVPRSMLTLLGLPRLITRDETSIASRSEFYWPNEPVPENGGGKRYWLAWFEGTLGGSYDKGSFKHNCRYESPEYGGSEFLPTFPYFV
jgi:hypothetical protein